MLHNRVESQLIQFKQNQTAWPVQQNLATKFGTYGTTCAGNQNRLPLCIFIKKRLNWRNRITSKEFLNVHRPQLINMSFSGNDVRNTGD